MSQLLSNIAACWPVLIAMSDCVTHHKTYMKNHCLTAGKKEFTSDTSDVIMSTRPRIQLHGFDLLRVTLPLLHLKRVVSESRRKRHSMSRTRSPNQSEGGCDSGRFVIIVEYMNCQCATDPEWLNLGPACARTADAVPSNPVPGAPVKFHVVLCLACVSVVFVCCVR